MCGEEVMPDQPPQAVPSTPEPQVGQPPQFCLSLWLRLTVPQSKCVRISWHAFRRGKTCCRGREKAGNKLFLQVTKLSSPRCWQTFDYLFGFFGTGDWAQGFLPSSASLDTDTHHRQAGLTYFLWGNTVMWYKLTNKVTGLLGKEQKST